MKFRQLLALCCHYVFSDQVFKECCDKTVVYKVECTCLHDMVVFEYYSSFTFQNVFFFYLKSSSAVAMSLPQKSKLPILEQINVCYGCNLQKETYSRRKENQFQAPDMHIPVIEINLHNITMYKSSVYFHISANVYKS